MKLLVTGGAGFIGSTFVKRQLSENSNFQWDEVTVVDCLSYSGNLENLKSCSLNPKFNFINAKIQDAESFQEELLNSDVVINFAAESHVDRSIHSSESFILSNVLGTSALLEVIRKSNKHIIFIQISTDEVYGSIQAGSWDELNILSPNSPYSASKASADLISLSFFRTHGIDVRITRCSNNFGPNQFPEKVIPRFITNLIDMKSIPIYGKGENIRDWLSVDDHCRGIELVIQNGNAGEIYNLGGGHEITNIDLAKLILSEMNLNEKYISFVPDRLGHDLRYSVDVNKAENLLGYKPEKNFLTEIRKTIDWYKDNEGWWRPLISKAKSE